MRRDGLLALFEAPTLKTSPRHSVLNERGDFRSPFRNRRQRRQSPPTLHPWGFRILLVIQASTKKLCSYTLICVHVFIFGEGRSLNCSTKEVFCCDFSSDGKLLAIAGREEKVLFWNIEDHNKFVTDESHSLPMSDVRFKPNSTIVATSSYDKTVQIWDSAEAGKSPLKLQGHGDHVLSLDFHPRRMNLLCSSDKNNEIRFWDINPGSWTHIFKGATKQVRFEPRNGKLLATSSGNVVKVFDVQTYKFYADFKGHDKEVQSICWDPDGKRIISISEDSARLWSVSERKSLHELSSTGNNFHCCTFHPWNYKFWIIGGYRSFALWNPFESNKTLTIDAHKELVSSLGTSMEPAMVASTSYDKSVKLWASL